MGWERNGMGEEWLCVAEWQYRNTAAYQHISMAGQQYSTGLSNRCPVQWAVGEAWNEMGITWQTAVQQHDRAAVQQFSTGTRHCSCCPFRAGGCIPFPLTGWADYPYFAPWGGALGPMQHPCGPCTDAAYAPMQQPRCIHAAYVHFHTCCHATHTSSLAHADQIYATSCRVCSATHCSRSLRSPGCSEMAIRDHAM